MIKREVSLESLLKSLGAASLLIFSLIFLSSFPKLPKGIADRFFDMTGAWPFGLAYLFGIFFIFVTSFLPTVIFVPLGIYLLKKKKPSVFVATLYVLGILAYQLLYFLAIHFW